MSAIFEGPKMKNVAPNRTKEEIEEKLNNLYFDRNQNDYDSDLGYQFYSKNTSSMLQFSSQWFNDYEPETTKEQYIEYQNAYDENGIKKKFALLKTKQETVKTEPKKENLNPLEKLSYLEINGERFRVVSATLEKCSAPSVKKTFNFTPKGLVETFSVPKFKKLQPIKLASNQKFIINRRLPAIRVNKPLVKVNVAPAPKVTIFRRDEPKNLVKIGEGQVQKRKIIILRKRQPLKPQENLLPPKAPEVVVLDDKSEKEEIKSEPEENFERCSSPSTDTGDEEILPENIMEEPEEKIIPETFSCGECSDIFQTLQDLEKHAESHKIVPEVKEPPVKKDEGKISHRKRKSDSPIIMATSKFGRTRRVLNIAQLHKNYGVV